jgi:Flp pilus assembly protein TadB
MSYCPKCGSKISEEMTFCPNCGASLKAVQPAVAAQPTAPPRGEKAEKGEKQEKREKETRDQREKREKGEKHEKRGQYGFAGPLIGGLILIFFGLMLFISLTTSIGWGILWAFFVVVIGIIIIIGAIYAATMASRRHPPT